MCLTIEIKCKQNTIVQRVIREMIELSEKLNVTVETDYNSTTLRVSPSSNEVDIYNDWKAKQCNT